MIFGFNYILYFFFLSLSIYIVIVVYILNVFKSKLWHIHLVNIYKYKQQYRNNWHAKCLSKSEVWTCTSLIRPMFIHLTRMDIKIKQTCCCYSFLYFRSTRLCQRLMAFGDALAIRHPANRPAKHLETNYMWHNILNYTHSHTHLYTHRQAHRFSIII